MTFKNIKLQLILNSVCSISKCCFLCKIALKYNNTFFGNLAIKEPKVKINSSGNSYTEIWALKIPTSMRLHLKEYYRSCSERCGYIEL